MQDNFQFGVYLANSYPYTVYKSLLCCDIVHLSHNDHLPIISYVLSTLYQLHPLFFFFFCHSDLSVTSAGPASASLLQDWLGIDVGQLNPEDMDAMEKELEAGAPDIFFNDLWYALTL